VRCRGGDGEEGLSGDVVGVGLLCANEKYPNYARRLPKFSRGERLLIYARVIWGCGLNQAARRARDPHNPILFGEGSLASAPLAL
jgi:hypothetical protein